MFTRRLLIVLAVALISLVGSFPIARSNPTLARMTERAIGSPSVGDIDQDVFAVMKANDVHGASLAIVDGARLVYAKGYTFTGGKRGIPTVSPTTLFRQASVSKMVTALAIMQLIHDGKLKLSTLMQSVLRLEPAKGRRLADGFDKITIQDLLEMRSGLDPNLPAEDVTIAKALRKKLPISSGDIETYAASERLISKPGDRSQAFYNNSDYEFLGYVVAKVRHAKTLVGGIQRSILAPLGITRIRSGEALKGQQLPGEAAYYSNPYQTATSVMTQNQPQVELGYGEFNIRNDQGAGGLSAAATDMARILAAMNVETKNPAFAPGLVDDWLKRAYSTFHDPRFTHSDAFGFYGLDDVESMMSGSAKPPYHGDKGGLLSTSQNAVYFQNGGLAYVICWSSLTPHGENWYPVFQSVMKDATKHDWGKSDLFPKYGMASFNAPFFKHPIVYPGGLPPRTLPTP